ncbi:hypothetical protein Chor_008288 [Crotalus horridus]
MQSTFSTQLACLCALTLSFTVSPAWLQTLPKKTGTSKNSKSPGCCEELKKLKVQVASLSSILEEMSKKQNDVLGQAVTQVMALEGSIKLMDARLNDMEGQYLEMNSQLGLVQLQAAQMVTQTSTDAVYDCSSLYQRNYRSSGIYYLPPDEFLGSPELQVRRYTPREKRGKARSHARFRIPIDLETVSILEEPTPPSQLCTKQQELYGMELGLSHVDLLFYTFPKTPCNFSVPSHSRQGIFALPREVDGLLEYMLETSNTEVTLILAVSINDPLCLPECLNSPLFSPSQVYCDMETNGGGWTVIQRRKIGLISFSQSWKQYKEGFGSPQGDFWLGNEHIHRLSRRPSTLRVELEASLTHKVMVSFSLAEHIPLWLVHKKHVKHQFNEEVISSPESLVKAPIFQDWDGNSVFAQYSRFAVGNELSSYRLFLANFSGSVPRDSMRYHNNTAFSTMDKDNDKCVDHCAQLRKGGYWYNCCTDSNLNGVYYRKDEHNKSTDGITWYGWYGKIYSLKRVEMKIRPTDFKAERDPNRVN